jgi:hypothetical protein
MTCSLSNETQQSGRLLDRTGRCGRQYCSDMPTKRAASCRAMANSSDQRSARVAVTSVHLSCTCHSSCRDCSKKDTNGKSFQASPVLSLLASMTGSIDSSNPPAHPLARNATTPCMNLAFKRYTRPVSPVLDRSLQLLPPRCCTTANGFSGLRDGQPLRNSDRPSTPRSQFLIHHRLLRPQWTFVNGSRRRCSQSLLQSTAPGLLNSNMSVRPPEEGVECMPRQTARYLTLSIGERMHRQPSATIPPNATPMNTQKAKTSGRPIIIHPASTTHRNNMHEDHAIKRVLSDMSLRTRSLESRGRTHMALTWANQKNPDASPSRKRSGNQASIQHTTFMPRMSLQID